jgi:hypothetical protein
MSTVSSPMKARIDGVLEEVAADLAQHGFTDEFLNRCVARIQAVPIETDDDRQELLLGNVRLVDYLIAHAPAELADILNTQRQIIQAQFDRLYGRPDTPYLSANRIVFNLLERMRGGGALEQLVSEAVKELDEVAFSEEASDQLIRTWAILRVRALERTTRWLAQDEHEGPVEELLVKIADKIEKAAGEGRLSPELILKFAQTIREPANSTPKMREINASILMVLLGWGVMFRPEAAPAMEPLRDRILGLLSDTEPSPPADSVATRIEAITEELEVTLKRDGFSEHAFLQAMLAIRQLPDTSPEQLKAALQRIFDIAIPYAPPEIAQGMMISRSGIEQQCKAGGFDPLSPEELRARAGSLLSELKTSLEGGESPTVAVTRAMTNFNLLSTRIKADDEESAMVLVKMLTEIPKIIQSCIKEEDKHLFREGMSFVEQTISKVDVLASNDQLGKAVAETEIAEQMGRFSEAADPQKATSSVPHIRQFAQLFRALMDRFSETMRHQFLEKDGAEINRIRKGLDEHLQLIGRAYSEEQFVQHQRQGLRRAALDLRNFERRRHLTIVHPAFPTNPITSDANCVFFSGSGAVADLVSRACVQIGMNITPPRGLQNKTHGRWMELRGSGVAIFDYSSYDPERADPKQFNARSSQAEAEILAVAGPIGTVAYETGWAYVLGIPIVIVANKGQSVPFDINIEPVFLEGTDGDVERLLLGIQSALYGAQPGTAGDTLTKTAQYAQLRFGENPTSDVATLLQALSDVRDATRVRYLLSAILARVEGGNSMLVLPAFDGGYPPAGQRRLFHVSPFRDWTKLAQEEARNACDRAAMKYQIGYERINPEILRAIWSDICEASFVLADITNFNPNALLELAMAQAIGRATLVITQNRQPHSYLPPLQKIRTHQYSRAKRSDLSLLLDSFLAGNE